MSNEKNGAEDMWTPYKELQSTVERYVLRSANTLDPQFHEFAETLRNHRQNFLNILKNPPKNSKSREEILKGSSEGFIFSGIKHQLLTKELIDETLIISDMYNVNEFMALDLLFTAQLQMPYHPGLTRGLIAVLLYYDGRNALTSALKSLVQARAGNSWILDMPLALSKLITDDMNKLQKDGLLERILFLIEEMDLPKELELLQRNRALGAAKHKNMVMKLFSDTRQNLADILHMWSAQSALPSTVMFRLLILLQEQYPVIEMDYGHADKITITLIMAFLNSISLNILYRQEDSEDIIRSLPLLSETSVFEEILQKLLSSDIIWKSSGLKGLVQFVFSLSITTMKSFPNLNPAKNITNEDEILIEAALSNKAFHFAYEVLFRSKYLHSDEFYIRFLHSLISNFILLMPHKIKDLRSRADESMRLIQAYQQEGIEPPTNLDNHFKYFMLMIAELYKNDPFNLNLAMDYWFQHTESQNVSNSFYISRFPSKQVALFKFVRLAGEILPAGLFVPYLKMIASLASSGLAARQVYNFLKPNGATGSTTISWDHFFTSLNRYYYNLRQELPPAQDTVYRQRGYSKGITPNEVKGLKAVLQIVRIVALYDDMSRVAICDHPGWKVLLSLMGLISCAMPIPLKGIIIRTLAALAKSPESASTVWLNFESAQIITTIPTTSSYQPRGIQTELEEIETRNEEYPLTIAILELLNILTDFSIPRLLGVGQRTPGFDPYLHFIINTVFLQFHTRSYKNPEEKWVVCNACLKILLKLLKRYEPAAEDFVECKVELQGGESTIVNASPGYHLMTQLHSNTEFLRLILYVLDEGCKYFDSYDPLLRKTELVQSTLKSLEILEHGLKTQHQYMTQLSCVSSSNGICVGLSRLLLGVNHRTGNPDYMINIAKYVMYKSLLQRHAYVAVEIVKDVSNEPGADLDLLSVFTSTPLLTLNIRHGFVECLDTEDTENNNEEKNEENKKLSIQCKDRVLSLMMQSITRPSPNLAHYLLGFEIAKDTRKTIIQQPGIFNYPRTCLHSILGILEISLEKGRNKITEMCYCFLYILVSSNKTSLPILRFLRTSTNQDFIQRHLSKLPFQGGSKTTDLLCMSWLLKICAIELRVGSGSLQISLLHKLAGNMRQEKDQLAPPQKLLMDLLHYIDFQLHLESTKSWEFFDPSQIEMVLNRCSKPLSPFGGPQLIDLKKLHCLITEELLVAQKSASAAQRKLMRQELETILEYAFKKNQIKTLSYATVKFVEGWCQATEILFTIATNHHFAALERQNFLLNLCHDLLQKMTSYEVLNEIKTLVSGTILMLLVNLHVSFALQSESELLPSSPGNTTMMKIILNNILQWILNSDVSSQKVRTHLCGALLYFLCIISLDKVCSSTVDRNMTFVKQLENSLYKSLPVQENSYWYSTIQVINSYGEKLIDIICQSCLSGHDVCKILGFSCLNKIVELDCTDSWIIYIVRQGYLKNMIDSLLESDELLCCVLQPNPQTLRPVYLFEAKMAMFIQMASSKTGAENLLENKILCCLSSMTVVDHHPDVYINCNEKETSFMPPLVRRYQQILLPMLHFCDELLTTLGTENHSCTLQIVRFLESHRDIVEISLRNTLVNSKELFLNEVASLTSVIARSTNLNMRQFINNEVKNSNPREKNNGDEELRAYLHRLQKLVLALLIKLKPPSEIILNERNLSFVQIVTNIMMYVRNQMHHVHMNHNLRNVLFEPYLSQKPEAHNNKMMDDCKKIYLGIVVEHLVSTTNFLQHFILQKKTMFIKEMSSSSIREYFTKEEELLDINKQKIIIDQHLNRQGKVNLQNVKYALLLIEHALYILWSHLDFYTTQVVTKSTCHIWFTILDDSNFEWKKLNELLPKLKKGLASIFTDNFVSRLLEIHTYNTNTEDRFIKVLVRRIKRLLQFISVK